MLWTIMLVLLMLWLLCLASGVGGILINILLIAAATLFIVKILRVGIDW